jgi:hypothetical protein
MRSLPLGLTGPNPFRVSEVRDRAHQRSGPGLRRWMLEEYGDPERSATAQELRAENSRRHAAAAVTRPARVA